jgi:hypothetical protein
VADIINLRQARKAKRRKLADETAAQNRLKFGQTKLQRTMQAAEAERGTRMLDGAKRDKD